MEEQKSAPWYERLYRAARELEWNWSLLQFVGLSQTVVSVTAGIGAGIGGALEGLPLSVAFALGLVALVSTAALLSMIQASRLRLPADRRASLRGRSATAVAPAEPVADPRQTVQHPSAEVERRQLLDSIITLEESVGSLQNTVDEREAEIARLNNQLHPPPGPLPTESEKVAIDDLRVAYRSIGKDASWQALKILLFIRENIKGDNPLSYLLENVTEPHKKARDKLGFCLRDGSTTNMNEVITVFGAFFRQYMLTVRWLHLAAGDIHYNPESLAAFHEWHRRHRAFGEELHRTLQRSRLAGLREDIEAIGWHERFGDDAHGFDPNYDSLTPSGSDT